MRTYKFTYEVLYSLSSIQFRFLECKMQSLIMKAEKAQKSENDSSIKQEI